MGNGIKQNPTDTTVFRQMKQSTNSFKSVLGLVAVVIALITYISTQGQEKGAAGVVNKRLVKDVERLVEEDHADEIEKVAEDVEDLFITMNEVKISLKENKKRDEEGAEKLSKIDTDIQLLLLKVEQLKIIK